MIGEEGAELVRPARERQNLVGPKPDFSCTASIRSRMSFGRSASFGAGNRLIGGLVIVLRRPFSRAFYHGPRAAVVTVRLRAFMEFGGYTIVERWRDPKMLYRPPRRTKPSSLQSSLPTP